MKHAFAWFRALALTTCLFTTASYAEGNQMTQDQIAVHSAIAAMTDAFQRGDIGRVMASYEPEATVVFNPEAPVADRTALTEMFEGMAAANPQFTYYAGHEVTVQGNLAMHISPWTMTATTPEGQPFSQSGLSVAVLRKQANGEWLMVIDNPHGQHLLNKEN